MTSQPNVPSEQYLLSTTIAIKSNIIMSDKTYFVLASLDKDRLGRKIPDDKPSGPVNK